MVSEIIPFNEIIPLNIELVIISLSVICLFFTTAMLVWLTYRHDSILSHILMVTYSVLCSGIIITVNIPYAWVFSIFFVLIALLSIARIYKWRG